MGHLARKQTFPFSLKWTLECASMKQMSVVTMLKSTMNKLYGMFFQASGAEQVFRQSLQPVYTEHSFCTWNDPASFNDSTTCKYWSFGFLHCPCSFPADTALKSVILLTVGLRPI